MTRGRMAFFVTRLIHGGAQKMMLDLIRATRHEYDVTLIIGKTPKNEPNLLDKIPEEVRLVRFDSVVREINPFSDLKSLALLYRFFRKEKFDLIHLHTSKAGVLGALAGSLAGIPNIIYTPHGHIFHKKAEIPGVSELSPLKLKILYILRILAYSRCHRLVALSEIDKREQVDLKLAPPSKFVVIMNGIDVDFFQQCDMEDEKVFREKYGLGKDEVIIGSIGRLSKEKGHDKLVKAFAALREKVSNAKLLIVGDGEERDNLELLACQKGCRQDVVFTGNLSSPRTALCCMTLFALPSLYESQGMAAMEAMSAGVPVVASNVGGIPGIIENQIDGLLVPPDDPEALADALAKLVENRELRRRIAEAALNRAKHEFTLSRMIDDYLKLYQETCF